MAFSNWLSLFLLLILLMTLVGQTHCQGKKFFIITDGSLLILPCKPERNYDKIKWLMTNVLNITQILYNSDDNVAGTHHENCTIGGRGGCNFEIKIVSREHAGTFSCQTASTGEVYRVIIEYEVVVGKLSCSTNIQSDHLAIAKSDCVGVETNMFEKTCTFQYNGATSDIPLRWARKWLNSYRDEFESGETSFSDGTSKEFRFVTRTEVNKEMVHQSFECSIENQPKVPSCKVELKSIQYVRNATGKAEEIHQNKLRPVTCSADKSDDVSCSYWWLHEEGGALIKYLNATLTVDQMKTPGMYTCEAGCQLGSYKECRIKAMEFKLVALETTNIGLLVGVVVGVIACVVVLAVAVICCLKRKKKKSNKKVDGETALKVVVVNENKEPLISPQPTNQPIHTPAPQNQPQVNRPLLSKQSQNGGGGVSPGGRTHSFKRGQSRGSQDFQPIREEEGNDESPSPGGDNRNESTLIGQKIPLNDARAGVQGVCHLGNRIFCVDKQGQKLFIFDDSPPYNRMIPEEVTIQELIKPQCLVACPRSHSVYISDYNGNVIYRVFPNKEGNKVSRGLVDGNPAGIALVSLKPNTLVAILKRDGKMHIEVYDSSKSVDSRGSVSERETWEKKYVITFGKDVALPLFLCVSGPPTTAETSTSQQLYLLYGSGQFHKTRGEFEVYKISQINIETSRVSTTFNLKDLLHGASEKFTPTSMVADQLRGGILVLEGSKGQLVHLNSELKRFVTEIKVGGYQNRFCVRPEERIVIFGSSSSKPYLACHRMEQAVVTC